MAPAIQPLRKKDAQNGAAQASARYFASLLTAKAKDIDGGAAPTAAQEAGAPLQGPFRTTVLTPHPSLFGLAGAVASAGNVADDACDTTSSQPEATTQGAIVCCLLSHDGTVLQPTAAAAT